MQYSFGTGTVYGKRNDAGLSGPATPVLLGALQGASVEFSMTVKELFGRKQYPLALGRGTGKITGKADFAQFNAQAFNDLFFGQGSVATGATRTAVEEAATVTANAVNVSHNTTFLADYGVISATTGAVYSRVANTPVGAQYTCNETTGAYGFNATQNNVALKVSYTYSDAANGKQITITNQLLGNAPTFVVVLTETYQAKALTMVLNACMSSKLALATKLEDFTIPAFDFSAFADDAGNIGSISLEE